MSTRPDEEIAALLHAHVDSVQPDPAAWERLRRGSVRRGRVRRGAAVGGTLALLLVAVPAVGGVADLADRTGREAVVQPASPSAPVAPAASPVWPLVSAEQVAEYRDDPESVHRGILPRVGSEPGSLDSPLDAVHAVVVGVLRLGPDALVTQVDETGDTATAVVSRGGDQELTLTLGRDGAGAPWLLTGVVGSTLTVDSPARESRVAPGATLSGSAPAGVGDVYLELFYPGGSSGYSVPVVDGRWNAVLLDGTARPGVDEQLTLAGISVPAGPVGVLVTVNGSDGPAPLQLGVTRLIVTG